MSAALGLFSSTEIVTLPEKDFTVSFGGHTYNCYYIDSQDHSKGVSIGAGDNSLTPIINTETISIPASVTSSAGTFQVKGIATAGFRNCQMKEINLPDSVTNIGEEAFAYCQSLTTFIIPYQITEIKPSTFLDCRALTSVYYGRENSSEYTTRNYSITRIGDHAFDSCVSLASFNCPRKAEFFGRSCFQNCKALRKISFPTIDNVSANKIVIEPYAFADCIALRRVYMEENINHIYDYAFADCHSSLLINYTGSSSSLNGKVEAQWRQRYLAKNRNNSSQDDGPVGNLIKINFGVSPIRGDPNYPGLGITISTDERLLNCGTDETDVVIVPNTGKKYAIISSFSAPDSEDDYMEKDDDIDEYYDITNKLITIPDTVVDPDPTSEDDNIPVKVIEEEVFQNSELKGVTFNGNLVQICNNAFSSSSDLASLDFSNCTSLREVSYQAFNGCEKVAGINLPYSLEYIGAQAFQNCKDVTSMSFYNNNRLLVKTSEKWVDVDGEVLHGFSIPNNSNDGDDGDYYIDLFTNKAYLKSSGSWSELTNVTSGLVDPDPSSGVAGHYYITRSRLKVICEKAFYNAGVNKGSGYIDLVLPETLNDQDAVSSKVMHIDDIADNFREVAVQRSSFEGCKSINTVTMAKPTSEQLALSNSLTYTCSIGTNAFKNCTSLMRFQTSENFYTIGSGCFTDTTYKFKELFLHSAKASLNSSPYDYPFGIGETTTNLGRTLFLGGNPRTELVIYVKGSSPKKIDTNDVYTEGTYVERWNSERGQAFPNYYSWADNDASRVIRSHIPTYYNIDWQDENSILYWRPNPAQNESEFMKRPNIISNFNKGVIAFIKDPANSSNYIATHYYLDDNANKNNQKLCIDLTNVPANANAGLSLSAKEISNNLKTIGSSAFGASSNNKTGSYQRGNYFILPESVTRIEERAFYRAHEENYNYGVRVVTYRNSSGKIIKSDGTAYADDTAFQTYIDSTESSGGSNNDATAKARKGYCCISNYVTYIGRDCFYNHIFESIRLGTGVTFLGTSAFSFLTDHTKTSHKATTITSAASNLSVGTSGGLYYTYTENEVNKKILIYQPPVHKLSTTLSIDDGTSAIGRFAVADTDYVTINLPNSVTTIYGGAFQNNLSLTEVTGGTGLKYIGAYESISVSNNRISYQTVWNNSMPFDIFDYQDYLKTNSTVPYDSAMFNTFKNCTALTTINFKDMTDLVAIGRYAFRNCGNLNNLTGNSRTYSYYYYQSNHTKTPVSISGVDQVNLTSSVLDLTPANDPTALSQFRTIGTECFYDSNKIKFVHIPKTSDPELESKLNLEKNAFKASNGTYMLISETAEQAAADNTLNWLGAANHYISGWNNSNDRYFYVDSAFMILNDAPSDSYGVEGSYCLNRSNGTFLKKVSGTWTDVTVAEPGCTIRTDAKKPDTSKYNYGDYWYSGSGNCLVYKKVLANNKPEWRGVGDLPTTETYDGTNYSNAKYNYWTYDSNGNVIIFKQGNNANAQQLAREFFYYGIAN